MLNVKVDRKELLRAIQVVENAVTENKIREVLSGIYIEAVENKIILIIVKFILDFLAFHNITKNKIYPFG